MTQYFVVVNQWSADFEQGTEILAVKKSLEDERKRVDRDEEFKAAMYAEDAAVVYENAYKISCIYEIYDILRDSYDFSCAEIATILDFKGNILEQIYDE